MCAEFLYLPIPPPRQTWYFSPYHYSIERFPDALDADIDPAGDPPEPSDRTSVAYGYDEDPVQIELFVCEFCLKPLESRVRGGGGVSAFVVGSALTRHTSETRTA